MQPIFNTILDVIRSNRACVTATIVSTFGSAPRKIGAKMVICPDGKSQGTIGGGALEKLVIRDALVVLKRKKSELKIYPLDKKSGLQVCGGKVSIFLEVINPSKQLVICGGGHIGLALYYIAILLEFRVTIIDNRREFANKKRFDRADKIICGVYSKAIREISPDEKTYIVIVTHGHLHDEECLAVALETNAGYIGMIGSRIKIKKVFASLRNKGFKNSELKKVYTPIGLDIGAQTPEEIAVAIAAELIKIGG